MDRTIKVLWFSNTPSLSRKGNKNYYNGGGWISALEQQIRTVQNIDLTVAFYSNNVSLIEIDEYEGVKYIQIPKAHKSVKDKLTDLCGSKEFAASRDEKRYITNLLSVIDYVSPDVIQIFGSENKFGLIAKYIDIPTILHIQGILTPCLNAFLPPGFNWKDYVLKPFRLRSILFKFSEKFAWEKNILIEQEIYKNIRYVFGRTDFDRHVMDIMAPQASYIFCNEILRAPFYEATEERSLPTKAVFVTTISYPSYKGVDLILKTAKVLKSILNFDFEWNVYGLDGASITEEFVNVSAADVNVAFKGTVNVEKLIHSLKSSTAYIHPSYIENGCIAISEAQALGVTPIAVAAGGVTTTINNLETGILVPANDPFQMAWWMKHLYDNPEENINIGENARKVALVRHDRDAIVQTVLSTYHSMINSRK